MIDFTIHADIVSRRARQIPVIVIANAETIDVKSIGIYRRSPCSGRALPRLGIGPRAGIAQAASTGSGLRLGRIARADAADQIRIDFPADYTADIFALVTLLP